jgi:hypothetical protein
VQIDGRARRDLKRLAEQTAHHLELPDVGRRVGERPHRHQRVQAEHDGARKGLAARLGPPLVLEHPAPRVQADAETIGALELEPVIPLGLDAGLGITGHQHAGGEVAAGIAREVGGDGQPPKIEITPGDARVSEGRVGHDHRLDRVLDAPGVFERECRLRHAECERQRPPARHHVAHDRDLGAAHGFQEQDGKPSPPLVLEHERHDLVLERHRLGHPHHLVREGLGVGGDEVSNALAHGASQKWK